MKLKTEAKEKKQKNSLKTKQTLGFLVLKICIMIILFILCVILFDIISKGIGVINWEFLSSPPREGMTAGGIWPAIAGTLFVTLITSIVAVPVGVFAAIYLNEYAVKGRLTRIIRMAIRNLAGVPSIVYGLFGLALFVKSFNLGTSVLSAGLTLGLMTLPVTITASEEALKAVPQAYRSGSLALGVSKWYMIRTNVIPHAVPGILTGAILGLSRAAGETAPILFTGAAFFLPRLPNSVFSQFMALPYHLYILATQHHNIARVRPIAYGTALVLIILILLFNMTAIMIRYRYRKKKKG